MTATRRWIMWIVLLAAVAGMVLFAHKEQQGTAIVDAVPRRPEGSPTATSHRAEAPMILAIRPRSAPDKIDDAFPVRDWRPLPPPARAGLPAPEVAPVLPYVVLGKKLEDGAWQVFLGRDKSILVVKTLDIIDNAYQVDEIRPPVMTLTYLPLRQRQTLPIGGAE